MKNTFLNYTCAICAVLILAVSSCEHTETKRSENDLQSWEVNGKDTSNRTDFSNRKQGIWYVYKTTAHGREITDTLFYKDGKEVKRR